MRRDPVTVRRRRLYASVELDVWPLRLSEEGQSRMVVVLEETRRRHRVGWHRGRTGCYIHRIVAEATEELAAELRTIASDPACVEEAS